MGGVVGGLEVPGVPVEVEVPRVPVGVDCRVGSSANAVGLFREGLQLEGSLPWPLPPKLEGERVMVC